MRHIHHYLKKEIETHLFDYTTLISLGVLYLVSIFLLQDKRSYQIIATFVFSSLYVVWGILHHSSNKSLHHDNVLEYIFIAVIMIILLQIIIFK